MRVSSSWPRWVTSVATVAALATVLGGCGSSASSSAKGTESAATTVPGYAPVYAAGPCPMPVLPDPKIECGTVTVPENRAEPTGAQVHLAVARVSSPAADGAGSPVVRLSGGPGFGALQPLNSANGKNTNPLLAHHDLIYIDQRGTGYSQPNLDCPERDAAIWTDLGRSAPYPTEYATVATAIQACKQRLEAAGIDLAAYDTVSNATDIADVRVAMGIPSWTLSSVSYATLLAQEIMRSHPEGVRAVVLDSVVPPDYTAPEQQVDSANRAFDTLFTGCEQSPTCNAAYPKLRDRFAATLASYDQNPFVTTIKDRAGTPHAVSINGGELLAGIFNTMYSTKLIPSVPALIVLMEQRNPALQTGFEQGFAQIFDASDGVYYSVDCRDRLHDATTDKVAAVVDANPDFGFLYQLNSTAGCATWNNGATDASFNQLVSSDIPTLVLAGSYDPITPPSGSKRVADNLAHATYVEFDGTGHGVFRTNPCADQLVLSFVAQPSAPLDTSCVSTVGPPAFHLP